MAKKLKSARINGSKRKRVRAARIRMLELAYDRGSISNKQARRAGGWAQAWFHLNAMAKAGYLKHNGYNTWIPAKRKLGELTDI